MTRDLPPSRTAPQFVVRLPDEAFRARLADAAKSNGRSMNSEIVARLEQSFVMNVDSLTTSLIQELGRMRQENLVNRRGRDLDRAVLQEKLAGERIEQLVLHKERADVIAKAQQERDEMRQRVLECVKALAAATAMLGYDEGSAIGPDGKAEYLVGTADGSWQTLAIQHQVAPMMLPSRKPRAKTPAPSGRKLKAPEQEVPAQSKPPSAKKR